MSKEKQVFDATFTDVPQDAYNEQPTSVFNAAYFAQLRKNKQEAEQKVAPVSQAVRQETSDREKKIKELYPDFYEKDIPLEKLVFAPKEWNFFPAWNSEKMAELMENISVYGQLAPALVWEQEDGTYMILGGHNRYRAIKNLHDILQNEYPDEAKIYTTMRCNVYAHATLDEVEARKIIIYDNTIRRENSRVIQCRSVINMNQLMKETREKRRPDTRRKTIRAQIAESMNVSEANVDNMIRLRNLIPEFWSLIDSKDKDEKISITFAQNVAYLSQELQKYIYDSGLHIGAKLSAKQYKALRNAKTKEDVEAAFAMQAPVIQKDAANGWQDVPAGYRPIPVVCKDDETLIVEQALMNADLSQETKDLLYHRFHPDK